MIIIVSILIGFICGSIYTWYIIRKFNKSIFIDDIKQFIEENKQKIINVILDMKEYFPEIFDKKSKESNISNSFERITPYGTY